MKLSALVLVPMQSAAALKEPMPTCDVAIIIGSDRGIVSQFVDVGFGDCPRIEPQPLPKGMTPVIAGKPRRTDDFGSPLQYVTVGQIRRDTCLAGIEPFDVICASAEDTPVILYWSESELVPVQK